MASAKGSGRARGVRSPKRDGAKGGGVFRERLGSLENELADELRRAGGEDEVDEGDGPLARATDGALDLYARLARTVEHTSVADALAGLGSGGGDPDDFGLDPDFERALMPLLRFLYRSWWRVQIRGIEHVPSEGPVVLVANSSGSLFAYDGAMLRMGLREEHPGHRSVRPLLADTICDLPVVGELMSRTGGVRDSEESGRTLLRRGAVVACFPEGAEAFGKPFHERYEIRRFVGSAFVRLALSSGAPIVPVAIVGAEETHPVLGRLDWFARRIGMPYLPLTPTFPLLGLGGLLPLPSRWRIEFGAPLTGLAELGLEAGNDADVVRGVSRRARRRLQTLIDGAVERRGRAFF